MHTGHKANWRELVAITSADDAKLRAFIIGEIKRLAAASGGRTPGVRAFEQESGITQAQWRGVIWARWSDAVVEAGYQPNDYQQRYDGEQVLTQVLEAARHYKHLPTSAELRLYGRRHPGYPNDKTILNHFPTKAALASAIRQRAATDETLADILAMLPEETTDVDHRPASRKSAVPEGWVYLIKSGQYYKIGRGEDLERRVKQIRVALPERGTLVHAIRTDDPAGIEAYWHRRFDTSRMNGEWFNLSTADVAAFKRRKFM